MFFYRWPLKNEFGTVIGAEISKQQKKSSGRFNLVVSLQEIFEIGNFLITDSHLKQWFKNHTFTDLLFLPFQRPQPANIGVLQEYIHYPDLGPCRTWDTPPSITPATWQAPFWPNGPGLGTCRTWKRPPGHPASNASAEDIPSETARFPG